MNDPSAKAASASRERESSAEYVVLVDDNYRYQDDTVRHRHGAFDTLDEAVRACKEIVDRCLEDLHESGMTAKALLGKYKMFGEDPWIRNEAISGVLFSAWTYAEERCEEICRRTRQ